MSENFSFIEVERRSVAFSMPCILACLVASGTFDAYMYRQRRNSSALRTTSSSLVHLHAQSSHSLETRHSANETLFEQQEDINRLRSVYWTSFPYPAFAILSELPKPFDPPFPTQIQTEALKKIHGKNQLYAMSTNTEEFKYSTLQIEAGIKKFEPVRINIDDKYLYCVASDDQSRRIKIAGKPVHDLKDEARLYKAERKLIERVLVERAREEAGVEPITINKSRFLIPLENDANKEEPQQTKQPSGPDGHVRH